jgi:hypothetical protein
MTLLLGLARNVAHAVPAAEGLEALCGTTVETTEPVPFPGSGRPVCRSCARESARSSSTVPLPGLGGRKRPGGM